MTAKNYIRIVRVVGGQQHGTTTSHAEAEARAAAAEPSQVIPISFTQEELQFLVEALRDLPISGTPDSLAQMLPLIQAVRLKFSAALQAAIEAACNPAEPTPIQQPPEEAQAAER